GQVDEGSAGLHERTDAAADGADAAALGEPGQGRAVAVRGAVPGPEPDDHEAGPWRHDRRGRMGGLRGRRPGYRPAALDRGFAAVPEREARSLGLTVAPAAQKETPGAGRAF